MSRAIRGTILWQVVFTLLKVYLVSTARINLHKRSTSHGIFDDVCLVTTGDRTTKLISFNLGESITDLKSRTYGLKQQADSLKDFLKTQHGIPDDDAKNLDSFTWMNREDTSISETEVKAAISKPVEAMKSHYRLLTIYRLYVKQVATTGKLVENKNEGVTREMLHKFESKLRSYICSVKLAIYSSGSDVESIATTDNLSRSFLKQGSFEHEVYKTYITMQDGVTLMEFLNTIYQRIEASITETEA